MSKTLRKLADTDWRIEGYSDETFGRRVPPGADASAIHDGHWLYLVPGWRHGEIHCVHEWTVKDCLRAMREIEPCSCEACRYGPPV